jgi:hypothetical protein
LKPPMKEQIQDALVELEKLLQPLWADKSQWYRDPAFDKKTVECLQDITILAELEKAHIKWASVRATLLS